MVPLKTIGNWLSAHWLRVVIIVFIIEAIGALAWWFKPRLVIPPAITRILTPKKPPVSYSFKGAPKGTGFSLLSDNTKSGGFRVLLGNTEAPKVPEARFEVDKSWLAFSLATANPTKPFEKKGDKGKDTVVWKEVLTDADARYQIVETGLKEDIILKSDFSPSGRLRRKTNSPSRLT